MKWFHPLIFLLFVTSHSLAASPSPSAVPDPCPSSKMPFSVSTHTSSAEILTPLTRPIPIIPLGCERPFIYQSEVYSTDSPQVQDAATLKYFMRSVPEASSLLEDYQNTRRKAGISAFSGTFGILLFALSPLLSRKLNRDNPDKLRNIFKISAGVIAVSGFFYSFTLLNSNEALIPKAVDSYNQAKPNDPIEIRFQTGWSF